MVAPQMLRSRIEDEAIKDEDSGSEEEYPIRSNSPIELRTTRNCFKQIKTVLKPVGISSPPRTTNEATSPSLTRGNNLRERKAVVASQDHSTAPGPNLTTPK